MTPGKEGSTALWGWGWTPYPGPSRPPGLASPCLPTPRASPTTLPLTLQGRGASLGWWCQLYCSPPWALHLLPPLPLTSFPYSLPLSLTPAPISVQLSLPKGSFSNFSDEVKGPKAHFRGTWSLPSWKHLAIFRCGYRIVSVYLAEVLAHVAKTLCLCESSHFQGLMCYPIVGSSRLLLSERVFSTREHFSLLLKGQSEFFFFKKIYNTILLLFFPEN